MAPAKSRFSSSQGFSLIEVIIAMGLLTVVSLSVAQMFATATNANAVGRGLTSTTTLAEQKMEQIRSLTFGFDPQEPSLPFTDTATNLANTPHTQNGVGLNPSPADVLDVNTAGFVDYLNAQGTWIGTGTTPPAGTVYIRRWAIQPLPTNPNNTLVLQVLVTTVGNEARWDSTAGPRRRMPGDALLVSVRTRKAS
jgi:prepilin-type N-terminal cleavage/methylation domain-containing protein